jgi:hypothetical protein
VTSGIASCSSSTYGGPDNATAIASGNCTDVAGNVTGRNFALAYDATAPAVTVTPARNSDQNGWYNNSLGISWHGVDPTSGIASCTTPVTYSGPDTRTASASGSCTDNAGNSAAGTLQFSYDDSPPTTVATPSRSPNADGWFKAPLSIAWSGSDPISGLASCSPSLAYNGPDTAGADKTGSCTDTAGKQLLGHLPREVRHDAPGHGRRVHSGTERERLVQRAALDRLERNRRDPPESLRAIPLSHTAVRTPAAHPSGAAVPTGRGTARRTASSFGTTPTRR